MWSRLAHRRSDADLELNATAPSTAKNHPPPANPDLLSPNLATREYWEYPYSGCVGQAVGAVFRASRQARGSADVQAWFGDLLRHRRRAARRVTRRQELAAAPDAVAAAPPFLFSRMGPKGSSVQIGKPLRLKLAQAMTADNLSPGQIPAGFTYLGQFIDHDLTFDKSALMEGVDISPATLLQSRSPSLDLDSLYGNGPADPGSAKFYKNDGVHLKKGAAQPGPPGSDLLRKTPARTARRSSRTRAMTRTSRWRRRTARSSDSTTAWSTRCPPRSPPAQRFRAARKIVTKHYQWMVRTDYLPRICTPAVVTDVFTQAGRCSRSTPSRPACRRCRSSSRWPPSGLGTAWCAPSTAGTRSSRTPRWRSCSSSPT